MSAITKDLLRALRGDLDAALAAVAAKHGVELRAGSATYSQSAFTFKLEGNLPGSSKDGDRYRANAVLLGMQPEWLGQSFEIPRRGAMRLVGMNSTATKVLLEDGAGKKWLYPPAALPKAPIAKVQA